MERWRDSGIAKVSSLSPGVAWHRRSWGWGTESQGLWCTAQSFCQCFQLLSVEVACKYSPYRNTQWNIVQEKWCYVNHLAVLVQTVSTDGILSSIELCIYVCVYTVCVFVPFCQHFQSRATLSPALYHPGRVKSSQEASGTSRPHGPEGLHRNTQQI